MLPLAAELQRWADGTVQFDEWLYQFRERGWIQPLRFGMTREQLVAELGEPDDYAQGWRKAKAPMILKYGLVEFHFGPAETDRLLMIYSDTPEGRVELSLRQGKPCEEPPN